MNNESTRGVKPTLWSLGHGSFRRFQIELFQLQNQELRNNPNKQIFQ